MKEKILCVSDATASCATIGRDKTGIPRLLGSSVGFDLVVTAQLQKIAAAGIARRVEAAEGPTIHVSSVTAHLQDDDYLDLIAVEFERSGFSARCYQPPAATVWRLALLLPIGREERATILSLLDAVSDAQLRELADFLHDSYNQLLALRREERKNLALADAALSEARREALILWKQGL